MLRVARPVDEPLRVTGSTRPPGIDKDSRPVPRGGDGRAYKLVTLRGSPAHDPRLERPGRGIADSDAGRLAHGDDPSIV